ncbi:BRCA1-associated RING domain protein 1 [Dionaea muscipula]
MYLAYMENLQLLTNKLQSMTLNAGADVIEDVGTTVTNNANDPAKTKRCEDMNYHSVCLHVLADSIRRAPQIYYENDTVKNLKKELARGAKLKCSYCGIKGATLGCYAKTCRRSYHVPCSLLVEECSWDTENYLMLCPDHSSVPFPNKKSSKRGGKRQAGTMQM